MKTAEIQRNDPPSLDNGARPVPPPIEVRRTSQKKALVLTWENGQVSQLSARVLRDNSQSAGSKRLRLRGLDVPASDDLTIEAIRPVGAYALNLVFSDGHDRGIYPWSLLRDLVGGVETPPTGKAPAVGAGRLLTVDDFLIGN
ncbi:DUF971 domain-containing protein [Labrenzia sp. 011]|uniref:gamma-butyrobetaine hydroxylase-like domain-containing protein n=1 Tax=Labrenzia sp. 011 TaxID=2171494 RepID=UPI000D522926|nr:DUF971 domain-containing protein [Labrenzia sp. 011]PVB62376.1 hypothetical protein DCO57_06325 [Labrenzia sp. 011]